MLMLIVFIAMVSLIVWQTNLVEDTDSKKSEGGLRMTENSIDNEIDNQIDEKEDTKSSVIIGLSDRGSDNSGSSGSGSSGSGSSGGSGNSRNENAEEELNTKLDAEIFIVSEDNYNKDENFIISIDISAEEEIYAVEFQLVFEPEVLELIDVEKGDFLSSDADDTDSYSIVRREDGKIIFADTRISVENGVSGQGTLAEIEFKAKNIGSCELNLSNVKIADSSLNIDKFKIDIKNAELTVQ